MVNAAAFSKRLEQIITHYGLTASSFAEAVQVNRSSISHLLSGRNKPSLDFVLKVIQTFPEVELYWFLNGKGSFPVSNDSPTPELKAKETQKDTPEPAKEQIESTSNYIEEIERIVIFYKDGTFSTYKGK